MNTLHSGGYHLPGGSRLDGIQARKNIPKAGIIIISARHSLDDKIKVWRWGLPGKTFSPVELNARIKALLRRKQFNESNI